MKLVRLAAASASLVLVAGLAAAPVAMAEPDNRSKPPKISTVSVQKPIDLRVPKLAVDATNISLIWNKPEQYGDIVDYHVYQDGKLIGSASNNPGSPALPHIKAFYADPANAAQVKVVMNNFNVTGLEPDTSYRFTVRSVNAQGVESKDSNVVTQRTTKTAKIFNVVDYGAVGDATTLNTKAIQRTIDAATPGSTVLIPAGTFKSGALWLKSDLTFEVAEGATLLGSENAADYPYHYRLYKYSTDERFYSLINADSFGGEQLRNIRIVGQGTIDGNGWKQAGFDADGFPISTKSSSSTVLTNGILAASQTLLAAELGSSAGYPTRSNLITLRGVEGVYYTGFTALNPSNHTLVNLESDDVTVNGVKLLTFDDNNADGIEFAEGDGLTVYNVLFDTGDDCMNFAAGLGEESVDDPSTQNAWIFNNYFREGHGAVVAGSHTGAVIKNVTAEDNVLNKTDVGLRMKTNPTNGGGAENFLFRDNAMKNITNEAFIFTSEYSDANAAIAVEPAKIPAYFRNIRVENVTVDKIGKESIKVVGIDGQAHRDIHFDNVRFLHGTKTNISQLQDSSFNDVVFDDVAEPWVIKNSAGLSFTGTTTPTATSINANVAPTWPQKPRLAAIPAVNSVQLSWPIATDNTAIAQYKVFVDDRLVQTVAASATTAEITALAPRSNHTARVLAYDATGNVSELLQTRFNTIGSKDKTAPVVPDGSDSITVLGVDGAIGSTWVGVQWTAATDDVAVYDYEIAVNGRKVLTVPGDDLTATVGGLTPNAEQVITVTAVDASGNRAKYPASLSVTTTPYPSTPTDPRDN